MKIDGYYFSLPEILSGEAEAAIRAIREDAEKAELERLRALLHEAFEGVDA